MGNKLLEFVIAPDEAGTRLDRCLSRLIPDSSRSSLQMLIRDGRVRADGAPVDVPRYPVRAGMRVFANVGCASMGYGLPAAIGAALAGGGRETICLTGDGRFVGVRIDGVNPFRCPDIGSNQPILLDRISYFACSVFVCCSRCAETF